MSLELINFSSHLPVLSQNPSRFQLTRDFFNLSVNVWKRSEGIINKIKILVVFVLFLIGNLIIDLFSLGNNRVYRWKTAIYEKNRQALLVGPEGIGIGLKPAEIVLSFLAPEDYNNFCFPPSSLNIALKIQLEESGKISWAQFQRFEQLKRECTASKQKALIKLDGSKITHLDVSKSLVTNDQFLDLVSQFPNLQHINLGKWQNITEATMQQVIIKLGSQLKGLEMGVLGVSLLGEDEYERRFGYEQNISEDFIRVLDKYCSKSLEKLSINPWMPPRESFQKFIKNCINLKSFLCFIPPQFNRPGYTCFIQGLETLPQLETLDLANFSSQEILEILAAILEKCPLRSLQLKCSDPPAQALQNLFKRQGDKLIDLNLYTMALSVEDVNVLSTYCHQLKTLQFCRRNIPTKVLKDLLINNQHLHSLVLSPNRPERANSYVIADEEFQTLLTCCPQLRHFKDGGDFGITTAGIETLLPLCPNLESVAIRHMNEADRSMLSKKYPHVSFSYDSSH